MTTMSEPILVVNAGSSSIKFSVFETMSDRSLAAGVHGEVAGLGASPRLEITDPRGRKLADGPEIRAADRETDKAHHIGRGRQPLAHFFFVFASPEDDAADRFAPRAAHSGDDLFAVLAPGVPATRAKARRAAPSRSRR